MPRSGTIERRSQDEPENFGSSVRSLRQLLGISQTALGKKISYSQRLISDIENGKVEASQAFQDAIAAFKKLR